MYLALSPTLASRKGEETASNVAIKYASDMTVTSIHIYAVHVMEGALKLVEVGEIFIDIEQMRLVEECTMSDGCVL